MKLLILSSFRYQSFSGQGLILTNTINYLLKKKIEFEIIYFRLDNNYVIESDSLIKEINYFDLPILNIKQIIKSFLNLRLSGTEYQFLNHVNDISLNYQSILLFGSAFDPLISKIPEFSKVPVIYNITDSITLFETSRITFFYNFRIFIARKIEKNILTSNFKFVVYVGFKDMMCAKKMVNYDLNKIVYIPLGVNSEVFKPSTFSNNNTIPIILFTGILSYKPNHEACIYIINNILPKIRTNYKFKIVGKNPSVQLLKLANLNKSISVVGYVDDISAEYRNADIYLCPMRSGAGMKNKILEALSTGLPVITSDIEKHSFEHVPGGISFCNSDGELVDKVEFYLKNPLFRIRDGKIGREFVLNSMTWEIRSDKLLELLK